MDSREGYLTVFLKISSISFFKIDVQRLRFNSDKTADFDCWSK
jgi:hypothetical protein